MPDTQTTTTTTTLENDLVTVPQACHLYLSDTHPETVYRLIRSGQFPPAVHIGRKVLVSVPKLKRYLHGEAVA